ncbi:hypothetical protein M569_01642, partial [Genlisea aurea]
MVERRKRNPLVLSSTEVLVNSLLNLGEEHIADAVPAVELKAGVLIVSKETITHTFDGSALVGVSTSVLKRLSTNSGSLVLIKSTFENFGRIGQLVVLDPPTNSSSSSDECIGEGTTGDHGDISGLFPSHVYGRNRPFLDSEVAYLSPILGFNLNLHLSCFKSVFQQGKEELLSLLDLKADSGMNLKGFSIGVSLIPHVDLPEYASHLRASFVKLPECGHLRRLRTSSLVEAEERQDLIDLALNEYFSVDRYLSVGDLFSICINWNCHSDLCISCNQKKMNGGDDAIYFKVITMHPSEKRVLRVNRSHTALVLGGNVASAVPPNFLIPKARDFTPIQEDAVSTLASVIAPTLCPSVLSSKFRVAILLQGVAGCGKRTVTRYVARQLGLHIVEYSCHSFMASSENKTSVALSEAFRTACRYRPTILLLRHFEVFRNLYTQEGSLHEQVGINSEVASVIKQFTEPNFVDENDPESNSIGDAVSTNFVYAPIVICPVLLVSAADSAEGLPPAIRRCFSHEIKMGPLTEEQRSKLLYQTLEHASELFPNTSVGDLVKELVGQTSGFLPRDLQALISDAVASLISEKEKPEHANSKHDVSSVLGVGDDADSGKKSLIKALERSKRRTASALGTPKVPNVKWEDVGGLEDVKKTILDTVQLPLMHKELFSSGLRKRSGVLLYGPPGTGKTLLAKAVATECSLNFLSVKGPELINMYIGESEKNIRDIFQKARAARPCVIFFDELDSLAPARGVSGDSGGVMDRVVSQMLAEIDGLTDPTTQDLFIIGASNRPDLIDPALLRPGRFDKLLYVGINSDVSYRERVLRALTRKLKLGEDVSLCEIAVKCPPNFTGADMYALCADAWFRAAKRKVLSAYHPDSDEIVVVEYEDFIEVLSELSPSLSMAELRKYEMLRDQLQG